MENRIKNYVDELFEGIYITGPLKEMKEEICVNLLEKINDYITSGESENSAYEKAIANLGDMDELLNGLKKASEVKMEAGLYEVKPLAKSHIAGYIIGSALFILGLLVAGFFMLQNEDWLTAGKVFSVFFILSSGVFTYFGLTQENQETYPMSTKRALAYSGATVFVIIGGNVALFSYLETMIFTPALIYLAIFCLPAIMLFIYLGLSEKSRSKFDVMDSEWQRNWINKYSNSKNKKVKDLLSGAIWIFSAGFFMLGLMLGYWYAWLIFLFAVGFQILLEAYFAAKI
ncbi:MAG: hypothetical protein JEZ00_01875 [Anaerolineaceae bacterium]|nr:hypothetical protein [Anaerolineaceae bacterium]